MASQDAQLGEKGEKRPRSDVAQLLDFAGGRRGLTYLGCALSAVSQLLGFGPYVCIWLVARDLIAAAPDWQAATAPETSGSMWASRVSVEEAQPSMMRRSSPEGCAEK